MSNKNQNCICGHEGEDHFYSTTLANDPCQFLLCKCQNFNTEIPLTTIKSKKTDNNVVKAGYRSATQTMVVEFKSGAQYFYNKIKHEDFEEFKKTFDDPEISSGSYFMKNFRKSEHFGKIIKIKEDK
jgi:hypothetical protein